MGELVGAHDFPLPSLFCKYFFETGGNFRLMQGHSSGQTHCDMPPVRWRMAHAPTDPLLTIHDASAQDGDMAIMSHPIDLHYALKGIDGWPRLRIEVYGVDQYGRIEIAGYGCCIVPTSAGTHEVRCMTWRPCGSLREQFWSALRSLHAPMYCTRAHLLRPHACDDHTPGTPSWPRPLTILGRHAARCTAFFLGGTPRLKHTEVASSSTDRFRLQTEPSGEVLIRLHIMHKDMAKYGVLC